MTAVIEGIPVCCVDEAASRIVPSCGGTVVSGCNVSNLLKLEICVDLPKVRSMEKRNRF